MSYVNIGGPITLGIIGAILAFALPNAIEGIDLTTIGYILMIGAVIWLVLGLLFNSRRSTRTHQSTVYTDQGAEVDRRTDI